MDERLKRQLDFALEIDKEKNILRQTHLSEHGRRENDAEHAWHKDSESYLRAVTSTIGRIRQKIEDDKDHPRYIKTVSNIGYQFVPSSESVRLNRNL